MAWGSRFKRFVSYATMIAGIIQMLYSILALVGWFTFVIREMLIFQPIYWFGVVHTAWMFVGGLAAFMLEISSQRPIVLQAAGLLGTRCGKGFFFLWCGSYSGIVALLPSGELPWWVFAFAWYLWLSFWSAGVVSFCTKPKKGGSPRLTAPQHGFSPVMHTSAAPTMISVDTGGGGGTSSASADVNPFFLGPKL